MRFFKNLLFAQVLEAVHKAVEDSYATSYRKLVFPGSVRKLEGPYGTEAWHITLDGLSLPMNAFICEGNTLDCDDTARELLNDPTEQCICLNGGQEIPNDEYLDGLVIIVDNQWPYFVTDQVLHPSFKDKKENNHAKQQ